MNHLAFIKLRRERISRTLNELANILNEDLELLNRLDMAQPEYERTVQNLLNAASFVAKPHTLYHFERTPSGWACYDDNYEPPDIDGVGGGLEGHGPDKATALADLQDQKMEARDTKVPSTGVPSE
jgi:hypothetical protein